MPGRVAVSEDADRSGAVRLKKICHMSSLRDSHDLCMFQREARLAAGAGYDVVVVAKGDSRVDGGVQSACPMSAGS